MRVFPRSQSAALSRYTPYFTLGFNQNNLLTQKTNNQSLSRCNKDSTTTTTVPAEMTAQSMNNP